MNALLFLVGDSRQSKENHSPENTQLSTCVFACGVSERGECVWHSKRNDITLKSASSRIRLGFSFIEFVQSKKWKRNHLESLKYNAQKGEQKHSQQLQYHTTHSNTAHQCDNHERVRLFQLFADTRSFCRAYLCVACTDLRKEKKNQFECGWRKKKWECNFLGRSRTFWQE